MKIDITIIDNYNRLNLNSIDGQHIYEKLKSFLKMILEINFWKFYS